MLFSGFSFQLDEGEHTVAVGKVLQAWFARVGKVTLLLRRLKREGPCKEIFYMLKNSYLVFKRRENVNMKKITT